MKGLRHFFPKPPLDTPELSVHGVGVRELMPPCIVDRPSGTGDYLFMLFLEPVVIRSDGQIARYAPRSLVLWAPEHGHYYGNPDRGWRHSWIHCQGHSIRKLLSQTELPLAVPMPGQDVGLAERCLLSLYQELVGHSRPDALIVHDYLRIWLREVRRGLSAERESSRPPDTYLNLKTYLETHYAKRITLSELASDLGVTPQHLSAQFKQHFGIGPIGYVIRQRLEQARYLLLDQNLSVTEVAARVGYTDVFQFSRIFTKHYGVSPKAMRH